VSIKFTSKKAPEEMVLKLWDELLDRVRNGNTECKSVLAHYLRWVARLSIEIVEDIEWSFPDVADTMMDIEGA
jgi:hypothetical protein